MPDKFRRILIIFLALALVAGAVSHGIRASDAGVKMVAAAATDMPMPGKCDGCGDNQKGMTAAACFAYCSGVVALLPLGTIFEAVPAEILGHFSGPSPTGHTAPPDPYPPRPAVLS